MFLRPAARSLLLLLALVRAVAADLPPSGPVVELPKYTVRNEVLLPPRESWRYTAFPGFEVLAQTSDRDTVKFLQDLQMFQQVIEVVWPDLNQGAGQMPTALVLFNDSQTSGLTLPEVRLTGDRDELELSKTSSDLPTRIAAVGYSDSEAACIFINLGSRFGGAFDPYRQFYREYVSYLIERRNPGTAFWLREGMARVFAGVDFTNKWFTLGQVGSQRADGGFGDFNFLLAGGPRGIARGVFPSLDMMLRDNRTLNARERALANAFVHMCIYGRGHQYQQGFLKYIGRAKGNFVSEEFFTECFGMSIRQMQDEIQGYVSFADYSSVTFKATKGHEIKPTGSPVMRAATQAEIGRIKGDAYRLAKRTDAARVALLAPYLRHEQDADLLAALGIFEIQSGRGDYARQFLESAVAGHSTRARAAVELARLREGYQPPAPVAMPDASTMRRMPPLSPALRNQLACQQQITGLLKKDSPVSAEDIALVEKSVADYPDAPNLFFLGALFYGKAGLMQKGIELLDKVQDKLKPADAERFAKLRANLVRKLERPGTDLDVKAESERAPEIPPAGQPSPGGR